MEDIIRIKSISEFYQLMHIAAPQHPLISVYDEKDGANDAKIDDQFYDTRFTTDMYCILYKDSVNGKLGYGRNSYDFQHGTLLFVAPGQVLHSPSKDMMENNQGWVLMFHPDLIRKSPLGENIDDYTFFSYQVNEALHLSEKEERFIFEIIKQIEQEYAQNIDKHSQRLIVSNLELFLNYCTRFYDRQFFTRTNFHKDFVSDFEQKLKSYFSSEKPIELGIPSVSYFGELMNMSASYLSDLLKKETGRSTKSHINDFLIEKA
ncbi:MAG: AraC family transcriptional regulator, partial [Bacteroidota bacterium]